MIVDQNLPQKIETKLGGEYNVESVIKDDGTQTLNINYVGSSFENKIPKLIDGTITEITEKDLEGVTTIRSYAFYTCANIQKIPPLLTVTHINAGAFQGCTGLTSVTIGEQVIIMGNNAFSNCTGLNEVNYLGDINGWCRIASFTSSSSNPVYYAKSLKIKGEEVTDVEIDHNVGGSAFAGCQTLTSVSGGENLKTIGYESFRYCENLLRINLPYVTSMTTSAFRDCVSLASVVLGDKINNIAANVFTGCIALETLRINRTTPPTIATTSIPSTVSTIYIPTGSLSKYESATNWSAFAGKFVEEEM